MTGPYPPDWTGDEIGRCKESEHDVAVEAVASIIGSHLGFNPWADHWREPTARAAEWIVKWFEGRAG